jgi:NAD(P)H-dependent flavin oxidoreductase YrpB (nitropropane dioxygenase family)
VRTALTELLGIEHPVIQGALGPWTRPELVSGMVAEAERILAEAGR